MQRAVVAFAQLEEELRTDTLSHVAWSIAHRSWHARAKPRRFGNRQAWLFRYTGTKRACSRMVQHSLAQMDTLGIEPRASRMLSGCDTTTPRAPEELLHSLSGMIISQGRLTQGIERCSVRLWPSRSLKRAPN